MLVSVVDEEEVLASVDVVEELAVPVVAGAGSVLVSAGLVVVLVVLVVSVWPMTSGGPGLGAHATTAVRTPARAQRGDRPEGIDEQCRMHDSAGGLLHVPSIRVVRPSTRRTGGAVARMVRSGMRRNTLTILVLWLCGCPGDFADIIKQGKDAPDLEPSTGEPSTGVTSWMPTSGSTGAVATDTGAPPGTTGAAETDVGSSSSTGGSSSETGAPIDPPPWITDLACDPASADEVGPTLVTYTASPDAVEADLLDDGQLLATGPANGSFVFPVVNAETNNPGSTLTVVVRDAGGQEASDSLFQPSNVKEAGSPVWTTLEQGSTFATASAAALQDGHAVVAGFQAINGKLVGTLRRYDTTGHWFGVVDGWERLHTDWTKFPDLQTGGVSLSGIAVDTDQAIVVVGTALGLGEQNMYVVRFHADGSLHWEIRGEPGTGARGVGIKPDGTIFIAGSQLMSTNPDRYDWRVWVYDNDGRAHGHDPYKDPTDFMNKHDEFARAVAVLADGRVVVGGMGEITDPNDQMNDVLRGIAILYEGKGKRVGEPWISPGDQGEDEAIFAAVATTDGFATCGYAQDDPSDPTNKRQILVRWHGEDLKEIQAPRLEFVPGGGECNALGYNLDGETIVAATIAEKNQGDNSWIFAVHDAVGLLTSYMKRNGLANGTDRILGLRCEYMCAWAGAEEVDGAMQWIAGMIRG
jgi:hypothetical protein